MKTQELLQRVEDMKKRNEASKRKKEEKSILTPSRPNLPPFAASWEKLSTAKKVRMEDLSLPVYVKPKENPSERSFISFVSSPMPSRLAGKQKRAETGAPASVKPAAVPAPQGLPTVSRNPLAPMTPVGPVRPVRPVGPVTTATTVTPVTPVGLVRPVTPATTATTATPVGPVTPATTATMATTATTATTATPVDPVRPVRPVGPRRVLMTPSQENHQSALPSQVANEKSVEKVSVKREKADEVAAKRVKKTPELENSVPTVTKLPSNVQPNHSEVKKEAVPPVQPVQQVPPAQPAQPHHHINAVEENGKHWYEEPNLNHLLHRQHQLVYHFVRM